MTIQAIIAAVAVVLAIVVSMTAGIVKAFNIQKDWVKQVITWVISVACAFGTYFMGYLDAVPENLWYVWVTIIGILVGLAANGIWDITKWFPSKQE